MKSTDVKPDRDRKIRPGASLRSHRRKHALTSLAKPTGSATYERARRLANIALWSVHLQCRRLRSPEPEDAEFVFRRWADFDFLVIALTRLRRAARLAAGVPKLRSALDAAIEQFDSMLPGLKEWRDVAEHIDDYALDRGRKQSVRRNWLEVSTMTEDGPTLRWLGSTLNAGEAVQASQRLFAAVKAGSRRLGIHNRRTSQRRGSGGGSARREIQ